MVMSSTVCKHASVCVKQPMYVLAQADPQQEGGLLLVAAVERQFRLLLGTGTLLTMPDSIRVSLFPARQPRRGLKGQLKGSMPWM